MWRETEPCLLRYGNPNAPGNEKRVVRADDLAIILGYRYISSAICREDEISLPGEKPDLTGRPGTRAPHLWLEHQGQRISTIDLFDKHFVLLAGENAQEWCDAARTAATQLGIELKAYRVGTQDADLIDRDNHWHTAYGISPVESVLVRSDGFVGWRSHPHELPSQDTAKKALQQLLCKFHI